MTVSGERPERLPLTNGSDVVLARRRVRDRAVEIDLDRVLQTKIVTAASELGRNTVIHGGGGELVIEVVRDDDPIQSRVGLRLIFTDSGPGIAALDKAMTGGWSSGTGLGLGLPGSQRLVNDFELVSEVGRGTRVTAVIWRRP